MLYDLGWHSASVSACQCRVWESVVILHAAASSLHLHPVSEGGEEGCRGCHCSIRRLAAQDLMYDPVALACGHKFCSRCAISAAGHADNVAVQRYRDLLRVRTRDAHCPVCRAQYVARGEVGVFEAGAELPHVGELIKQRWGRVPLVMLGCCRQTHVLERCFWQGPFAALCAMCFALIEALR